MPAKTKPTRRAKPKSKPKPNARSKPKSRSAAAAKAKPRAAAKSGSARPRTQLAAWFERNGYVRRQNAKRASREVTYKKGDEVRLVARNLREAALIIRTLRLAGFKAGSPFQKASQFAVPIYGRAEVDRFLEFIGYDG